MTVCESTSALFRRLDDPILLIDPHNLGGVLLYFLITVILVTKYDDLIAHRSLACSRPVQDDIAASSRACNRIRHEPFAVIQVGANDGLIRQDSRRLHQILINRQTSLILEVGPGDRGAMNF